MEELYRLALLRALLRAKAITMEALLRSRRSVRRPTAGFPLRRLQTPLAGGPEALFLTLH